MKPVEFVSRMLVFLALVAGVGAQENVSFRGAKPQVLPEPMEGVVLSGVGMKVESSGWGDWEGKLPPLLRFAVDSRIPLAQQHMEMVTSLLAGDEIICEYFEPTEGNVRAPEGGAAIHYQPDFEEEEYRLVVSDAIHIHVSGLRGLARATATLMQIWPTEAAVIPGMEIHDKPANSYRNFMVDLGRNPISLQALKETVDLLWFYKMDSLQLHLTDDQHFAFPSKKYPQLQSKNAWISWEGFQELEQYAKLRGIYLIPEIEVPGHSSILRRQYPDVFGESPTDLATLPSAREGIKHLLDEAMELFPSSPYVHNGGDEAYGVPEEHQRDLINDLNAYLKEHGKTTLVWEGPRLGEGDNKVDEDVVHINWRTINFPAPDMLKAGYKVINAAWEPLYLVDHYPRNNFTMAAPAHIYQQLKLREFGHFNPGIPTFHKPHVTDSTDGIIGYCMPWWEGREQNYMPMIEPRIIPLASVAWSEPEVRDVPSWQQLVDQSEAIRMRLFYPLKIEADDLAVPSAGVFHGKTKIRIEARWLPLDEDAQIRYTLDGTKPTRKSALYTQPFAIDQSATIRAEVVGMYMNPFVHGSRRTFVKVDPVDNLALGKPVTASVPHGPVFCPQRITDGGTGNLDYFLGYPAIPEPIAITIDLGKKESVGSVVVHTYRNNQSYESYQLQLSADGKSWQTVADRRQQPESPASAITHEFGSQQVRFVRILSSGHKGQVFDSFSRITEVQVFPPHPIDELMHGFLEKHDAPGAAVAVTKDNKLVYSRGFGFADRPRKQPVEHDSLFRIASISKPITSVAIFTLMERGKLELDSKIIEILFPNQKPDLPDPRIGQITVHQLLHHRGGWDSKLSGDPLFRSRHIAKTLGIDTLPNEWQICQATLQQELDFDPGTKYAYSNFGYMLLGLAIEKISGKTYHEYVQQAVLQPIGVDGMKLARTQLEDRDAKEVKYYANGQKMATVFGSDSGTMVAAPDGGFAMENLDAVGGWLASAEDLAVFASAVDLMGDNLLNPESVQTMTSRYPLDLASKSKPVFYGCGWLLREAKGGNKLNLWHNGGLPGTSTVLVARHDGYTWAVLFNSRKGADGATLSDAIDPLMHRAVDQTRYWSNVDANR